MAALSSSSI